MNTRREQFKKEFAMRLTARMDAIGMSQEELAEKAEIHKIMIYKYRQGISIPRSDTLARLALALNVSADELIGTNT